MTGLEHQHLEQRLNEIEKEVNTMADRVEQIYTELTGTDLGKAGGVIARMILMEKEITILKLSQAKYDNKQKIIYNIIIGILIGVLIASVVYGVISIKDAISIIK